MIIFKGSPKDSFLYLGIISIILLGIIFSIFSQFLNNKKDSSFFQWLQQKEENLFLGPIKNSRVESPDFYLIQKSTLKGSFPPVMVTPQILGSLIGSSESEIKKEIVEYIVQSGDNLTTIAENFDISLNTLLWANDLNKSSIIKPGQKLVILPVSGVIHHVKSGETLSKIAKEYKEEIANIIAFNELSEEGDIYIGDILIIPDGVMPPPSPKYVSSYVPLATSYFICPISSPCSISQGLHWYNAIDFTHGKCGELIYAAAGGKVLRVQYGWNKGAGNYLTVLHPNGVVTMYGHIASSLVSPGEQVSQGQMIALMGGQPGTPGAGRSTGCHLHFGVRGAKNPFAR
ncbi:LysM peptidoglycan-binding domain-containing protein [Patescibacteria group bacterium]|nr:LysM peptidoglycan-binding domain-containing protein [Patescibacteria group bacterium]